MRDLKLPLCLIFTCVFLACSKPSEDNASDLESADAAAGIPASGIYDNATESPLKRLIDSARSSLAIEIYEMREPTIHSALKRAVTERNVDVRIIIESKTVGSGCSFEGDEQAESEGVVMTADAASCDEYARNIQDLKDVGIEIRPFSKDLCGGGMTNCVQHGKLVIADNRRALVSTGNFNDSSLCSIAGKPRRCNRDFSVVIKDGASVRALKKVFENDFIGEPYDVRSVLESEPGHRVTVSPVSQPEMIDFVRSAERSVDFQAQYLKEPQLNDTLKELAGQGVAVRGTVASACSFGRMTPQASEKLAGIMLPLAESGVDLRMFTKLNKIAGKSAYMHSKVFIVDGAKAWVGSTNGSAQAFFGNREFGVFTDNEKWVTKLSEIVDADFESRANETIFENLNCEKEFGGLAQAD